MANESHWNLPWAARPPEEARIFNPAFCGELIARTVYEHYRTGQAALSMATAFLILPLLLHRATREALPRRANTAFAGWIAENAALLADLPDRTKHLRPISREAILFLMLYKLVALADGGLAPGAEPVRITAKMSVTTDEVSAARSAAGLLGRWFAAQGTQSSILKGLGVAP